MKTKSPPPPPSKPTTSAIYSTPSTGRKLFFDRGEYDRCARSLFTSAISCYDQKVDKDVVHRKILETFHGELKRLEKIIDDNIEQKKQ